MYRTNSKLDQGMRQFSLEQILELWKASFPDSKQEIGQIFSLDMVLQYAEVLHKHNEAGGFFSKRDSSLIWERHLFESMWFVIKLMEQGYVSRETEILDFGTGPGLPGFLFACLLDPPPITLLDAQRRKLSWIEKEFPQKKGLHYHYARIEETKKKYPFLVSRATVPYPWCLEVILPAIERDGFYCPFLARDVSFPGEEAKLEELGFQLQKEIPLPELDFLGKRHIRVLQKTKVEKKGFPRAWKLIQREIQEIHG